MLESLRIRSFRYQWGADLFATWAAEMETLLLGWYVLVDTGSPFLVGLVGALRFGGLLLAPLYGVVADQVDRRRLLLALRVAQGAQAAAFAALAFSGSLQPWHAFALSGLGGLVRNGENVVRQSLIADSVPQGALLNAMGLSRTTMDGAKMAGTLAGAALLSRLGMGGAYLAVTACYLLSAVLLLRIRLAPRPERALGAGRAGRTAGALADLRSGVAYMRLSPTIVAIMFLAFLVNLTVFPLTNGLMPVVARDVFGGGPEVLALLLSTAAVGALVGSLALVALPRVRRPERIMLLSIVSWHLLLLAFAGAAAVAGPRLAGGGGAGPAMWLVLLVLMAYGASTSGSMVTMSAVLLSTAGAAFRGRVMGVRMMAVYGLPLGLLLGGWLSERVGVLSALALLGLCGLALSTGAALRWPSAPRAPALRPAPAKA
ncbi:MAG TPA: MFS transporter [Chloroflexota bacterium]|nr:MFS transporter [Chloroflexota bacterium]